MAVCGACLALAGLVYAQRPFRVESELGRGTTFEAYFPSLPAASQTDSQTDISERAKTLPHGQGEMILVVDDEPVLLRVVQGVLEKHGYAVQTAKEGHEALALFARLHAEISAVITDAMMPGMEGSKLVQALRQLEPRLHIIGMTGLLDHADSEEFEALNLPVLLHKPFVIEDLLAALQQVLGRQVKSSNYLLND